MSNNKIIIYSTIAFLFISFVFLSAVEMKQADLNSKNVWMLYFTDPKNNSVDFVIENHSKNTNFHFEILSDKNKVNEGDVQILTGMTKMVPISINDTANKKITVDVTSGDGKKEIYKNF